MEERLQREGMLLGEPALAVLHASRVAVIGLGGVGSWCAEALVRAGIGTLVLVDGDIYTRSNMNRQLGALESTLGRNKAEVLAERFRDIAPEVKTVVFPELYRPGMADGCDYVADCVDMVSCKLALVEECREKGLPLISSMGTGNKLDAGLLEITDLSRTVSDPLARIMRKELRKRGIEHLTVVTSPEIPQKCESAEPPPPGKRAVNASLVWVTASAGMLIAQKIIMDLTGTAPGMPQEDYSKKQRL